MHVAANVFIQVTQEQSLGKGFVFFFTLLPYLVNGNPVNAGHWSIYYDSLSSAWAIFKNDIIQF